MSETNSATEFYVTFESFIDATGKKCHSGTRHKQEFFIERLGKNRYRLSHNGAQIKVFKTLTEAREKADEIAREVKAGRTSRAKVVEVLEEAEAQAATLTREKAVAGVAEVMGVETHANGRAVSEAKPGVVNTIVRVLCEATKDAPVTKEEVLAVLVKRFPDRDPSKMKSTVSGMYSWIPWPTSKGGRNLTVNRVKTDKGWAYWIDA